MKKIVLDPVIKLSYQAGDQRGWIRATEVILIQAFPNIGVPNVAALKKMGGGGSHQDPKLFR